MTSFRFRLSRGGSGQLVPDFTWHPYEGILVVHNWVLSIIVTGLELS